MKPRGFPIVKRHVPNVNAGASPALDPIIVLIEPERGAPASPLPVDHPLAIRFRQSRSKIVDVQSWKDAIQVGGIDLAVA